MTVKTSVSLTDQQGMFARVLVAKGHYPSLSAVVQHGLELVRFETEREEAEVAALSGFRKSARKALSFQPPRGVGALKT